MVFSRKMLMNLHVSCITHTSVVVLLMEGVSGRLTVCKDEVLYANGGSCCNHIFERVSRNQLKYIDN